MDNGFIDTSVQKAGIPGFPGCLEHAQMIWNSIRTAKQDKRELHVVWIDLANACGSVTHDLIYRSLGFFYIPGKIKVLLQKYFDSADMRFTTQRYTINWQTMKVGIMMGCGISPLLFIMCMEMLLRGAKDATEGEMVDGSIVPPPMKAFMDDVTTLVESRIGTELLLERLDELFEWCHMKAKPKKCRSLSIVHGQVKEIHFSVN